MLMTTIVVFFSLLITTLLSSVANFYEDNNISYYKTVNSHLIKSLILYKMHHIRCVCYFKSYTFVTAAPFVAVFAIMQYCSYELLHWDMC